MSKLKENIRFVLELSIFILVYIGSLSAVTYFSSTNIFDAQITYVNNEKMPYYVILELENKVDVELEYDIEIIYSRSNLVSGSERISCKDKCEVKIPIKKVFFDKYEVIIRTEYEGKHYEEKVKFNLEMFQFKNKVIMDDVFKINNTNINNLTIGGRLELLEPSKVFVQLKSQEFPEIIYQNEFFCNLTCDFLVPLKSKIILGEYTMAFFLQSTMFDKNFDIVFDEGLDFSLNDEELNLVCNKSSKWFVEHLSNVNQIKYDGESYSLANIFYNDFLVKQGFNFEQGGKSNFYAHFEPEDYEIIVMDNIVAKIDGRNLIVNIPKKHSSIIVITRKEYISYFDNMSNVSSVILNDIIADSVVINLTSDEIVDENEYINLQNKVERRENKLFYKTKIAAKEQEDDFYFEIEVNEQELNALNNIEDKMIEISDRFSNKKKSQRVADYVSSNQGRVDGDLKFSGRDIKFEGLKIDDLGVDLRMKKLNKRFEVEGDSSIALGDVFAFDPEKTDFDKAVMSKVARGNALYKCKEWDYDNEVCLGEWKKIMNLVPGENYSLELDKYDPAFAEANIIFEDGFEPGGALWVGQWTRLVETDSQLSWDWSYDSQYKRTGGYSLSDSPGATYNPSVSSSVYLPHISIITPPINLSGLTTANATFYQRVYLEADTGTSCWDAILIKVSTDGSTWNYIDLNGYTMRTISFNNQPETVTGDNHAICGDYSSSWMKVSLNLNPYVGNSNVYLKWTLTADDNTAFDGYNMDDFVVYGTENVNPNVTNTPKFNPQLIGIGDWTLLNMTIDDESELNITGTIEYANSTRLNYTLAKLIIPKQNTYDILSSSITEQGANVTVFTDNFANARWWFRDIGAGLNDWDITAGQWHADAITNPPQYVTLSPGKDLRNFSSGRMTYQYREDRNGADANSFEANDCLYYALNDGTGWAGNVQIFCDDVGSAWINGFASLSSTYMIKNFQMRFGANQCTATDEDVYVDNFNIFAWHKESKTTGTLFGPITLENYSSITSINVTVTVDSYNPSGSVANGNIDPDLYLAASDGAGDDELIYVGKFMLNNSYTGVGLDNTDRDFTITITNSTILDNFRSHSLQRHILIGAINLDYRSVGVADAIVFKDVKVLINGEGTTNIYGKNFTNASVAGLHKLTNLYVNDIHGNSQNKTYTNVNFTVTGLVSIYDGFLLLFKNNIDVGDDTTMKCQAVDNKTKTGIYNYTVSFYINDTLMGTNSTDATGWAYYSWTDASAGETLYEIKCNISNDASKNYMIVNPNYAKVNLSVWIPGTADLIKPWLGDFTGSPISSNVGKGFLVSVNITDNKGIEKAYMYVKRPGNFFYVPTLMVPPGTPDGMGIYTLDYQGDSIGGTYSYYFQAQDNWTNPNKNVSPMFTFSRTVPDALIKIKNDDVVYKRLNDIGLIPYIKGRISNTTVAERTAYFGTHIIFNDSFTSEFANWDTINNPGNDGLYCGDGGAGYENFDTDITGGASSRTPGTDNSAVRFTMEGDTYSTGANTYAYFQKNLNLSTYDRVILTFYYADNDVETMVNGDYPFSFEVYDGTWYQDYTIQGVNNGDTTITSSDYILVTRNISDYDMIGDFKIRFSGGGGDQVIDDSFAVDDVLVKGYTDDRSSDYTVYTFGSNNLDLSFFNITLTISAYDNRGSISGIEPDVVIEFYNGSTYIANHYCNLNLLYGFNQSSSTSDVDCNVRVLNKNIISAWENPANRKVRVRAEYMDVSSVGSDLINWTNLYFDYYTPSLIINPTLSNFSMYLSNRVYWNLTKNIVSNVNITPIDIISEQIINLSPTWYSLGLPLVSLKNGCYYTSSALTDGNGNVIKDSQGEPIVSVDYFNIENLYVNITSPNSSLYSENFYVNVTLDTAFYSSGGWCGYSFNGDANVSMTQIDATHFSKLIDVTIFPDYDNNVIVYCNDSTGDIVVSDLVEFKVFRGLDILFVPPTDVNDSYVNRTWTYVNVSVDDTRSNTVFVDFNRDLMCWIGFEDVLGNVVSDWSTYGNDAQMVGGGIYNDSLQVRGPYYNLDGKNDYLNISNISKLGDYTISFWFMLNETVTGALPNPIYLYEAQSLAGFDTFVYFDPIDAGKLKFRTAYPGNNNNLLSVKNIWNDSEWFNIVVSYDSFTGLKKMYLDGVQIGSVSVLNISLSTDLHHSMGSLNSGTLGFLNGSVDELMIFERAFSDNEIKSIYNAKVNPFYHNYTKLKNGLYEYYACIIDEAGDNKCTENRFLNINKTLPVITVYSPQNNSKPSIQPIDANISINANATQIEPVWFLINNVIKYNMTNTTFYNWSSNFNLSPGHYTIQFFGNDSVGNIFNSSIYNFYVLADYNFLISKSIKNLDNVTYLVNLSVNRNAQWKNVTVVDFVDSSWNFFNFSLPPIDNFSVSGVYSGTGFSWNLSIPVTNVSNIYYYINTSSVDNVSLNRNLIVGLD